MPIFSGIVHPLDAPALDGVLFLAKAHEVDTIFQESAMQQPYPTFVADSNVGFKILIINKNWRFEYPTGCIIPLIIFVLFR